jgi:hypothetical protein
MVRFAEAPHRRLSGARRRPEGATGPGAPSVTNKQLFGAVEGALGAPSGPVSVTGPGGLSFDRH